MSKSLNDMIAEAIAGGEEVEEQVAQAPEAKREAPASSATSVEDDVEKLASVMEFLGHTGVENLLEKGATAASAPPAGTNASTMHKPQKVSQVGHNKHSPPMKSSGSGKVEDNSKSPAGGGGSVDTSSTGKGDHHPALASNEAVINAKATVKSNNVKPAINKVLDATPFADPKAREAVSHAAEGGDKNTHKKTAGEHDLAEVRAELARRAKAAAESQRSAS